MKDGCIFNSCIKTSNKVDFIPYMKDGSFFSLNFLVSASYGFFSVVSLSSSPELLASFFSSSFSSSSSTISCWNESASNFSIFSYNEVSPNFSLPAFIFYNFSFILISMLMNSLIFLFLSYMHASNIYGNKAIICLINSI